MCGIAGTVGLDIAADVIALRELIAGMCDVIAHRGPDDQGYYVSGGVALGMRRLSIIDIATGRQPISNEDGTIWVVFNGEIYNYRDLREELISRGHQLRTRTDTETIVHLYEDYGERCVEKLRGMFAFAIWDSKERKLLLARDRVGKKPLHYMHLGDGIVFGSEIKSILLHPGVKREVNIEAISDFISFGYVPDPATAFKDIYKLPPGHTLVFKDGRIQMREYWDFDYKDHSGTSRPEDENYYIENLRDLLAESVRVRLESEVSLGAFLSGGIDSSTTVALMSREMNEPVKTFSIGFKEAGFDEVRFARITAGKFETDHHEFVVTPDICRIINDIVWHHDEPFADVSSVPTYVVSKMAREFVTVVLSGDGGDEVFGGYDRYAIEKARERYERIPRFIRRHMMLPLGRALPRGTYGKRFISNISLDPGERYVDNGSYFNEFDKGLLFSPEVLKSLNGYDSLAPLKRIYGIPDSNDSLDRLMYLDSKAYLPGDILVKVDRMSMANSIETRAPLLDQKLIEFVQTIPASLKLRGNETKYILKRAVEGIVPDEIINRSKKGFDVPIKHWFNHELRELLDDTIHDKRTLDRGYFNKHTVIEILDEHRRGRRDNARHLWEFLMLELWHRMFIDGEQVTYKAKFSGSKLKEVGQAVGD